MFIEAYPGLLNRAWAVLEISWEQRFRRVEGRAAFKAAAAERAAGFGSGGAEGALKYQMQKCSLRPGQLLESSESSSCHKLHCGSKNKVCIISCLLLSAQRWEFLPDDLHVGNGWGCALT